jgi:hypothetical protein
MDYPTAVDYQAQADKCMEFAERAKDGETELYWLTKAQECLALAEALAKDDPKDVWGGPLCFAINQSVLPTRH